MIAAFHVLMVWLMVAGLVHSVQGRSWKGGALVGLAAWLKLLPVIAIGYLLLKGKWRPAVIAIAVAATIDMTLSVAAFGPQGAWHEHLVFVSGGAIGTVQDQMEGHASIDEDRITNESTIVVLRRLLTLRGGYHSLAIADLSPQALSIVTACVLLSITGGVLFVLRRPASALSQADWGGEIALLALCTVWLSPVVWSYHLTAAVPALAVIMAQPNFEIPKRLVAIVWIGGHGLVHRSPARRGAHAVGLVLRSRCAGVGYVQKPAPRAGTAWHGHNAARSAPNDRSATQRRVSDVARFGRIGATAPAENRPTAPRRQ